MLTNTLGSDRPDIAKSIAKKKLTFKEVKDSFYKFLYQAGIPFSHGNKLYIVTEYEDKKEGNIYKVNAGYYTANCRLDGITVGGKPVYVILLSSRYNELDFRQKNKIKILAKTHNIVIFDKQDWNINNIEDRQWLKPLTKVILKRWSKALFDRISKLEGEVKSKYNLNDLYERIDQNCGSNLEKNIIKLLGDQNKELKFQLRLSLFSHSLDVKNHHYPIIKSLSEDNHLSAVYVETCMSKLLSKCKTNKTLLHDESLLSDIFEKEIFKGLKNYIKDLEINKISDNLFKITNTKTFQSFNVFIGYQNKKGEIKLPTLALEKLDGKLIYGIVLEKHPQSALLKILSAVFLKDSHHKKTSTYCIFSNKSLLYLYENGLDKSYSLCLPIVPK